MPLPLPIAHLRQAATDIERLNPACLTTRTGINVPDLLRRAADEIEGLRQALQAARAGVNVMAPGDVEWVREG